MSEREALCNWSPGVGLARSSGVIAPPHHLAAWGAQARSVSLQSALTCLDGTAFKYSVSSAVSFQLCSCSRLSRPLGSIHHLDHQGQPFPAQLCDASFLPLLAVAPHPVSVVSTSSRPEGAQGFLL